MKNIIKSYFRKHPSVRVKSKELSKTLDLQKQHEYAQLKAALHKLEKEGFLQKKGKRYSMVIDTDGRLQGALSIVAGGSYGFVTLEGSKLKDIYISEKNLGTAFDGDIVEVTLFAKQHGKNLEGQIVEIIKRKKTEIAGVLRSTKRFFFVIPDDENIHRDIYIHKEGLNGATDGDKVVVGNIEWKSNLLNPEGVITEILGKAGSYDAEIAALAKEFNLSYKFPDKVLKEADNISEEIPEDEIKKRLDLRDELIFTIDPETAKDFDDAVSVKKDDDGNYDIGIHIADVSHYADTNTAIYREAAERATSVYFVGKVVPMLPEKLSNNVCSLVPDKDRLTFSVMVKITPRGKVLSYDIKKTVINSKRRFSYEEVQKILDDGKGELFEQIYQLNKIAGVLRKKRETAGSINFSTPEVEFKLDDKGKPVDVKIKKSDESHGLIEELMLLANKLVATHVIKAGENKKRIPFVFRVHDVPDVTKLYEFAAFVSSFGYSFDPQNGRLSKQFQYLFTQVEDTEEEVIVNEVAIRSMAKAEYSTDNIGHFGLAFKYYTHFTSPIRRFPDLLVHKILFHVLEGNKTFLYGEEELEGLCEHSSERERNAVNAERQSIKIKQLEYLKDKIGFIYEGVISGITNFGMFIQIKETGAEGLIRLRDMVDDYYIFDEKGYSLHGERTNNIYRLGDTVEVKIIRINEEKRGIDLSLLDKK